MKRSYSEPVPEPAAKQQDTQRKRDVRSEEYSKELSTATAYLNTTSTQLWTFKDLRQELQSAGCKHTTTALNLLTRASHVRMLRVSPAHCLIIRKGVSLSAGLERLIVEETLQEAATAPVLESPPPLPLEPPVATTLGTAPEASAPVDASPLQPAASAVPTELSTEVPAAETGAIFADVLDTPPAKSSSGSSTSGDSVPRQQPGETFEHFRDRFVDFWALEDIMQEDACLTGRIRSRPH